jgi:hypothetical protein
MAELLFELGMRLKGSEFVPELQQAAAEKADQKYEQVNIEPKLEPKSERSLFSADAVTTTRVSARSSKSKS